MEDLTYEYRLCLVSYEYITDIDGNTTVNKTYTVLATSAEPEFNFSELGLPGGAHILVVQTVASDGTVSEYSDEVAYTAEHTNFVIKKSTLQATADALREGLKYTADIDPADFPNEIRSLTFLSGTYARQEIATTLESKYGDDYTPPVIYAGSEGMVISIDDLVAARETKATDAGYGSGYDAGYSEGISSVDNPSLESGKEIARQELATKLDSKYGTDYTPPTSYTSVTELATTIDKLVTARETSGKKTARQELATKLDSKYGDDYTPPTTYVGVTALSTSIDNLVVARETSSKETARQEIATTLESTYGDDYTPPTNYVGVTELSTSIDNLVVARETKATDAGYDSGYDSGYSAGVSSVDNEALIAAARNEGIQSCIDKLAIQETVYPTPSQEVQLTLGSDSQATRLALYRTGDHVRVQIDISDSKNNGYMVLGHPAGNVPELLIGTINDTRLIPYGVTASAYTYLTGYARVVNEATNEESIVPIDVSIPAGNPCEIKAYFTYMFSMTIPTNTLYRINRLYVKGGYRIPPDKAGITTS